ncbi:hypothetical protein TPHA_0M01030 [Tetrapisispora phaffii CBS 4417]|uniref:Uncharacterized protein n=1 Tax=Tetrapisispora phaffii (strain ATCC 24235 / CBS 4417 / NBRC 1672 / NRRL Y-8282 / UCD 70-5) TaxID=1071381 RepID=G8C0G2_TETPH|nr:hypothetical protein TPHA_0M01030 [Tetrapisispora phaffii CBS 4417]CCE65677.1 hypothetical protein TPHA_0M01030 [Tetrapisispora phaffii CBS 4417]
MSQFIDLVKRGGNEAIKLNPPTGADFHITDRGSDWLFTVFCVNILFSLIYTALMFRKPVGERKLYYTAIAPTFFMGIAYFTMASNLGWTPIKAEFNHVKTSTQETHPGYRQVFYARYVGWFLAFPWVMVQLSIIGNTPLQHIFFNVASTEVFVVAWLIGSLIHSTYKWGYWVFGIAGSFTTCVSLMTTTRNIMKKENKDNGVHQVFTILVSVVMFLWFVYPVSWGLCEGGNVLQPDSEMIFYGVLDLLMLCFVPFLFILFSNYLGDRIRPKKHDDIEKVLSSPSLGSPNMNSPTPVPSPAAATPKAEKKKHKKKHSKK